MLGIVGVAGAGGAAGKEVGGIGPGTSAENETVFAEIFAGNDDGVGGVALIEIIGPPGGLFAFSGEDKATGEDGLKSESERGLLGSSEGLLELEGDGGIDGDVGGLVRGVGRDYAIGEGLGG